MKIEIWSDYVCPFCYIGKRRLEAAIDTFPHKENVEVSFKSFELDPNAGKYNGKSIHERIAEKYGTTLEQAKEMNRNIGEQASLTGLDFHFEDMKPTNTMDAHRLTKFAETKGVAADLTERLLNAYFTESRHIGDPATLFELAEEAGLHREETKEVLESEAFLDAVRADEEEARSIGVQGVPFFVINRKYAISGAQPSEVFTNALQQVWEEEQANAALKPIGAVSQNGLTCDENGCELPDTKE